VAWLTSILDSCDAGYYCTSDKAGETWCCPDSMDVVACAAAYTIPGGLVVQTAAPSSSSAAPARITPPIKNGTTPVGTAVSFTPTLAPSAGYPGANNTSGPSFSPRPTATSTVQQGAGHMVVPAGALALAAAGIAALL
jgi:hypothetical protein